jgi:hypothetical protein
LRSCAPATIACRGEPGFGFAMFYSLLGIPVTRLADRLNRRNIHPCRMKPFCGTRETIRKQIAPKR